MTRIAFAELDVSSIDIGYLALVIGAMSVFALTLAAVSFYAD